MEKHKIMALIDQKVNEVFAEVQEQEGIKDGDIDVMDALALDRLVEQATELIHNVVGYQRWGREPE